MWNAPVSNTDHVLGNDAGILHRDQEYDSWSSPNTRGHRNSLVLQTNFLKKHHNNQKDDRIGKTALKKHQGEKKGAKFQDYKDLVNDDASFARRYFVPGNPPLRFQPKYFCFHEDNVTCVKWINSAEAVTCSIDGSLCRWQVIAANGGPTETFGSLSRPTVIPHAHAEGVYSLDLVSSSTGGPYSPRKDETKFLVTGASGKTDNLKVWELPCEEHSPNNSPDSSPTSMLAKASGSLSGSKNLGRPGEKKDGEKKDVTIAEGDAPGGTSGARPKLQLKYKSSLPTNPERGSIYSVKAGIEHVVAGSKSGVVMFFDLAEEKLVREVTNVHESVVQACDVRENTVLTGGSDGKVFLFDARVKQGDVAFVSLEKTVVYTVKWVADNHFISSGDDYCISRWDIRKMSAQKRKQDVITSYFGHSSDVRCLEVFAGGDFFFSGAQNGSIRVWPMDEVSQLL